MGAAIGAQSTGGKLRTEMLCNLPTNHICLALGPLLDKMRRLSRISTDRDHG